MNITLSFYLPNEIILVEGTYGDSLFFISKGRCEVFINRKKKDGTIVQDKIRLLYEGDYFGEVALVTSLKRTASIKTQNFTKAMLLHRDQFNIMS